MLETVTKGFRAAKNRLAGKQEITPELIDESPGHPGLALSRRGGRGGQVVRRPVRAIGSTVQTTVTTRRRTSDSAADRCRSDDGLSPPMGPVDLRPLRPKGGVTSIMMVGLQARGRPPPPASSPATSRRRASVPSWSRPTSTVRRRWSSCRSWGNVFRCRSFSRPTPSRRSWRRRASRPPGLRSATWCSSTPPAGWRSTSS
jgi:hypothetical protein